MFTKDEEDNEINIEKVEVLVKRQVYIDLIKKKKTFELHITYNICSDINH